MPARAPKVAKQLNISLSRIEDFLIQKVLKLKLNLLQKLMTNNMIYCYKNLVKM